jgi:hypothetical protein
MLRHSLYGGLLLLGILLPVQIVLGRTHTSIGISLNASDFCLPFIMIYAGLLMIREKSWPRFTLPSLPLWLIGLSIIMVLAFINGVLLTGHIGLWALVNRLIGWFVLMGYVAAGVAGMTYLTSTQLHHIQRAMITALWATIIICSIAIMLGDREGLWGLRPLREPLQGLMGDRNAFALTFCLILILAVFRAAHSSATRLDKNLAATGVALIPLFIYFNFSLSGAIAITVALIMMTVYFSQLRKNILLAAVMGCTVISTIHIIQPSNNAQIYLGDRLINLNQVAHDSTGQAQMFSSDRQRITVYREALSLWRDHPLRGIGLGGHLSWQQTQKIERPMVIDSTPIWLLTETGLFGFIGFAGFAIMVARHLWTRARTSPAPDDRMMAASGLMILIAFGIMSAVLQLMYARILWLLLGFILTQHKIDIRK